MCIRGPLQTPILESGRVGKGGLIDWMFPVDVRGNELLSDQRMRRRHRFLDRLG